MDMESELEAFMSREDMLGYYMEVVFIPVHDPTLT